MQTQSETTKTTSTDSTEKKAADACCDCGDPNCGSEKTTLYDFVEKLRNLAVNMKTDSEEAEKKACEEFFSAQGMADRQLKLFLMKLAKNISKNKAFHAIAKASGEMCVLSENVPRLREKGFIVYNSPKYQIIAHRSMDKSALPEGEEFTELL